MASPTLTPLDVLLADGSVASLRPLEAGDAAGLLALHEEADDDSLRLRFFSTSRDAARDYVDHLVRGTGDTVLTLVAVVQGRLVAQATAERVGPDTAEVSFLVAADARGLGLGSLLLEHQAAACRSAGIRTFLAEVLADNEPMLRVFLDAGFTTTRTTDLGVVELRISTTATDRAVEAADERESRAEARSLQPLLYPASVALVGVRRGGGGLGNAVRESIVAGGFTGRLYVVHPSGDVPGGTEVHRSIGEIPEHLDLVVIAVPAERVLDAVRDAAAAGASSAVVISSGFSELGDHGRELEQQILRVARENSLRLVGPNCLGVLCNDPAISLNATFSRAVPPPGGLAIASQSGGVGIAMLDLAHHVGLGVHTFISLGNKIDVSSNDLLAAWYDDPRVTAAALYLESFGNAPKFARIARRFAERKPLLGLVGGRSSGGVRGGASHTAAAAAPAVGVDALFAQSGVIACHSAETMARTALVLTEQPLPGGRRVGVISNAGGIGVLAADAADELGLVVPEFSPALRERLGGLVQGTAGTSNPVDLGAAADAGHLDAVSRALLSSGEVDALVVALVATSVTEPGPLVACLAELRTSFPDTPIILVAMGGLVVPPESPAGVTVFRSTDDALEALTLTAKYAEWRHAPRDRPEPEDEDRARAARATARLALVAADATQGWLTPRVRDDLLAPYGLASVGVVTDGGAAPEVAARVGFPVAVKVADPAIVHKTERGLVRVGLRSSAEVAAAVRRMADELRSDSVEVIVQPVVTGVEVALGVVRDPGLGPLVMVAAGGVTTDVADDRAFLLPPITRQDAAGALRSLRLWPLLEGFRGAPPCDLDALVSVICSLGALASDVPEISELDLNPVIAMPDGCVLVDLKVRVTDGSDPSDGVPRQLRMPHPPTLRRVT